MFEFTLKKCWSQCSSSEVSESLNHKKWQPSLLLVLQCMVKHVFQPCNYQLSKSVVQEIKFGDITVMLV